jgi:hypothetical protein
MRPKGRKNLFEQSPFELAGPQPFDVELAEALYPACLQDANYAVRAKARSIGSWASRSFRLHAPPCRSRTAGKGPCPFG